MTDLWNRFGELFTTNMYFRAGFIWALIFVALVWIGWQILFYFYNRWLKILKFFQPTKTPSKLPTETGPSPAGMLLGCIGQLIGSLFLLAIGGGVIYLILNAVGS